MLLTFGIVFGSVAGILVLYFSCHPAKLFLDFHPVGKKIGDVCAVFVSTNVAFLPIWIFFLIRSGANPEGFWQNLVMADIGLFFLGGIQVILAFVLIFFLAAFFSK